MLNNTLQVLVSAFLIVSIDFAYLKLMKKYFSNQVKVVQGSTIKMDLLATFFCYIFLIFGLNCLYSIIFMFSHKVHSFRKKFKNCKIEFNTLIFIIKWKN